METEQFLFIRIGEKWSVYSKVLNEPFSMEIDDMMYGDYFYTDEVKQFQAFLESREISAI